MQTVTPDVSLLADIWRGLAPLGFLATCGFLWRVNGRLIRIETVLTGATGENGLNGEVGKLRSRTHELSNSLQIVETKAEVLSSRVDALEGR